MKSTLKIPSLQSVKSNVASLPLVEEKKEEQIVYKNEPFTFDQLRAAWTEYLDKMKEEGKKSESIILAREIEVDATHKVTLRLDNFVQVDVFNSFKPDLLRHLRQGLNNTNISIDAVIAEEATVKMIYTANDKFKYLTEKFPILEEMKRRFGLDSDF